MKGAQFISLVINHVKCVWRFFQDHILFFFDFKYKAIPNIGFIRKTVALTMDLLSSSVPLVLIVLFVVPTMR